MRKARNSKLALLLVFTMLATLFVAIPTASAATTNIVTATPTYTQNAGNVNLGRVWIYENEDQAQSVFSAGSTLDITVTILTSGVEFQRVPDVSTVSNFVYPLSTITSNTVSTSNIALQPGATTKTYTIRVTMPDPLTGTRGGLEFRFPVKISGATAGPVEVEISAPDTGISGGKFIVGNIAGTGTRAVALDTSTVQVGATNVSCGLIRIEEAVTGSLAAGDQIRLDLPADMVWNAATIPLVTNTGVTIGTPTIGTSASGFSRLTIPITAPTTTSRGMITIQPRIDVDDDATQGDITVSISGNSANVTSESIVIGKVAEFGVSVERVGDPKTIVAGNIDQEMAPFKIIENVAGSLTGNRTVLIEVPSYVQWWSSDPAITREKGDGTLTVSAAGGTSDENRHVKKYTVTASGSASTFKFERLRVFVDADAPEGDVTVKFSGTAGLEGELVLAKVVKPVSVSGGNPDVIIGKANQAVSDIVIKENAKAAISANPTVVTNATKAGVTTAANQAGWLVIDAPSGVTFAEKPSVTVTEGNIKIDTEAVRLTADNNQLWIRILTSSTVPSTIKLSGVKLTLDRTVPEGELKLDVTGSAVDRVTNRNSENTNDTAVASVVVANCITPAPGETKGNAVFTLGQASYTLNGQTVSMPVAPYAKNGRTYLPLRFCGNAIGIDDSNIWWDQATKTATLKKDNTIVQVKLGSQALYVNGVQVATMDVAPEAKDGYTMLPIRPVLEAFGAKVTYDAATQAISIEY